MVKLNIDFFNSWDDIICYNPAHIKKKWLIGSDRLINYKVELSKIVQLNHSKICIASLIINYWLYRAFDDRKCAKIKIIKLNLILKVKIKLSLFFHEKYLKVWQNDLCLLKYYFNYFNLKKTYGNQKIYITFRKTYLLK